MFLLDGSKPGSGTPISDTKILRAAINAATKQQKPYGIAGGINSQNITDLWHKYPEASLLDTASGVEAAGEFSPHKLQEIIKLLRA